jgi:hypothetical protein
MSNSQAGGPPFVACQQLLIQHTRIDVGMWRPCSQAGAEQTSQA